MWSVLIVGQVGCGMRASPPIRCVAGPWKWCRVASANVAPNHLDDGEVILDISCLYRRHQHHPSPPPSMSLLRQGFLPGSLRVLQRSSSSTSQFSTRFTSCRRTPTTPLSSSLHPRRAAFHTSPLLQHNELTPPPPGQERKVTFIDKDGHDWTFEVADGDNLLDIAQSNDLEMEGACGGSCACSTCHVIVRDEEVYDKMVSCRGSEVRGRERGRAERRERIVKRKTSRNVRKHANVD